MRIERKRSGQTLPRKWHNCRITVKQFDGYNFVIHADDGEGGEVRIILEREEATQLEGFINREIGQQRLRLKSMAQAYAELSDRMVDEDNKR